MIVINEEKLGKMHKNKEILIFIKNMKDPSAYYRLGQYLNVYEEERIKYINYSPDWLYKYYYDSVKGNIVLKKFFLAMFGIIRVTYYIIWDMFFNHSRIVIVNRQIFPRIMPFYGKMLLKRYLNKRKVYWDFDDNIIYDKEITVNEAYILQKFAEKIVVTSDYLKNTINKENISKVNILPTTDACFQKLNIEKVNSERLIHYNRNINIVWIGTKSSLQYLELMIQAIDEAALKIELTTGKKVSLNILCNKNVDYTPKTLIINNIQWTRKKAKQELLNAHIGIMPLTNTEFTRGKGGFKGIQYISAGVPCIMSPIGYNTRVIEAGVSGYFATKDEDWIQSIVELSVNSEDWLEKSQAARIRWQQKYSSNINKKFWCDIINER